MLSEKKETGREAFTLIEMMVVVALIGILIGGVFRLIGATGENAKRAETIDRLQRVENALSGFYAEYGTYPPVAHHGSPDPFVTQQDDGTSSSATTLISSNAVRACRSQPMAFEFPTPKSLDDFIIQRYNGTAYPANANAGGFSTTETSWEKVKLFRYGVLSFLLPRLAVIGDFTSSGGSGDRPEEVFFNYQQWRQFNDSKQGSYSDQLNRETTACARWMPNFEKMVYGGKTLLGIETAESNAGYPQFTDAYEQSSGNRHVLGRMTIRDGWDNDLFYYSAPPYQGYRIWSAGKDKKTFPPWIPLNSLSVDERKLVNEWIKDDIARFDR